MKITTYLLLGAALALSIQACKGKKESTSGSEVEIVEMETLLPATSCDPTLLFGEWDVIELNGNPVMPNEESAPFLGFDLNEMRVFGNSGCNLLTGAILLDSTTVNGIRFDQIGSTRRFCPNDSIEQPFLSALSEVTVFDFPEGDSTKVSLLDANGQKRFGLQKKGTTVPTE